MYRGVEHYEISSVCVNAVRALLFEIFNSKKFLAYEISNICIEIENFRKQFRNNPKSFDSGLYPSRISIFYDFIMSLKVTPEFETHASIPHFRNYLTMMIDSHGQNSLWMWPSCSAPLSYFIALFQQPLFRFAIEKLFVKRK